MGAIFKSLQTLGCQGEGLSPVSKLLTVATEHFMLAAEYLILDADLSLSWLLNGLDGFLSFQSSCMLKHLSPLLHLFQTFLILLVLELFSSFLFRVGALAES